MILCLALALAVTMLCMPPRSEYVVSIPGSPFVFRVCGKDRLDALMSLNATVWTKEEWRGVNLEIRVKYPEIWR